MSVATTILSNTGQVVIPQEMLDEFHWQTGEQLKLVSSPSGLLIQAAPKATGRNLADLIGMLKHEGAPLSTEAVCRPVDYSLDRAALEPRKT